MKEHWKNASPLVRAQIEALLSEPYQCAEVAIDDKRETFVKKDSGKSNAQAYKQMMDLCWSFGFDCDPPPTPAADKIAALKAANDHRELNRLYLLQGLNFEAEQEQRNAIRWQAMRKWASEPSDAERQAEELAKAEAQAVEAQIEFRAREIIAQQDRAALDKARAQARKELTK